jgi:AAA15 family ATPase/GTPase
MGIERIIVERTYDGTRRLMFQHGSGGPFLPLQEEAHGTRVWLNYLIPLLRTFDTGGVLVIDEMEVSLHPKLAAHLVDVFHSQANQRGAQLIFTSHESTLFVPFIGDDILMRDEVWFLEKDRSGATNMYALSDFKPRKHERTQSRYLTGSYGAVPQLFHLDFEDAVTLPRDRTDGRAAS